MHDTKTLMVFYHMDYIIHKGKIIPKRFAFTYNKQQMQRLHCQIDISEQPAKRFRKHLSFSHLGDEYMVYDEGLNLNYHIEFTSPSHDDHMLHEVYDWLRILSDMSKKHDTYIQFVSDQPMYTFPYIFKKFGDYLYTHDTCVDINDLIGMKLAIDGHKTPFAKALYEPRIKYAHKKFEKENKKDKIFPAMYKAEMYRSIYFNLIKKMTKRASRKVKAQRLK